MKMEETIRSVYSPMKPLPGGEERMWQTIDQALQGKAKDVQIRVQPRRRDLPGILLAVAAVIVLLLVSLAVARRLYTEPEEELLTAEATEEPSPEPTPELIQELRAVELVNAQVDDSDIFAVSEDKRYLARAVLPEGMCVDHWEINGEAVDAGERCFSLEFDSTGVKKVEAVLREERRVTCVNAYLQFLDENGDPDGWLYEDVCFEYDYTVPTTGERHPGGSITAYITPLDPKSTELYYWIIDGEKVGVKERVCGIRLDNLDRSVHIEAVMRVPVGDPDPGEPFTLGNGGDPAPLLQRPEDDRPAGAQAPTENLWQEVDYETDGVPFDPEAPARDGHIHDWVLNEHDSWDSTCKRLGRNCYNCSVCGREYSVFLGKSDHSLAWSTNATNHWLACTVCGYKPASRSLGDGPHEWVTKEDVTYCSVCGYVKSG